MRYEGLEWLEFHHSKEAREPEDPKFGDEAQIDLILLGEPRVSILVHLLLHSLDEDVALAILLVLEGILIAERRFDYEEVRRRHD